MPILPDDYQCDIGLEIHVQLNSESKAFCRDQNKFGVEPNTQISEVSLAYPGTLPMVNRVHLISAIKLGTALHCEINGKSFFDRKNYFYPDLTKGYQITQDARPICLGGHFQYFTGGKTKKIRIHHIHCEEDAGKSMHDQHPNLSFLDYNRAGTPLLEMVTEPDFHQPEEVHDFMDALQRLLRYIEISDANMEEGSLRCDCNISIRPKTQVTLGQRVEVKNINSKKFAQQAIEFELTRQFKLLQDGQDIVQETRLYDPKKNATFSMRSKEDVNDYRYFPDPDLQMVYIEQALIKNIQSSVSLTPWNAFHDLTEQYALTEVQATELTAEKARYEYFKLNEDRVEDKSSFANFIINTILPYVSENEIHISEYPIPSSSINAIFTLINAKEISRTAAIQQLIPALYKEQNAELSSIIDKLGIRISGSDNELEELVEKVLNENPDKVKAYHKGKKGLIGFFMGQAMKNSKGNFLPDDLKKIFEKQLSEN